MNGKSVPTRSWSMGLLCLALDAQPLDPPAAQPEVEDHACEQHRREQVRDESDDQRDGEPLDGTGAELEQEQTADDRGAVGVEDGPERTRISELDGLPDALAVSELLSDPLEDQHVGVDRH